MKNTHFFLAKAGLSLQEQLGPGRFAVINGSKTATLKAFYEQIGLALDFPDYYAPNLDSLDELLNDLDWIEETRVVIKVENTTEWLIKEKSEEKILALIDLLDATAEEWKWMDEEDAEEEVVKKELLVVFEDSPRIRTLLEEQEIPFETIS